MSEQPYDPYIPSGSHGAAGGTAGTTTQGGDPKTQQVSRVSTAVRNHLVAVMNLIRMFGRKLMTRSARCVRTLSVSRSVASV